MSFISTIIQCIYGWLVFAVSMKDSSMNFCFIGKSNFDELKFTNTGLERMEVEADFQPSMVRLIWL